MTLLAQALDRRITILKRNVTRDAIGSEVVTWTTRATVWAGKRDISGRERILADQEIPAGDALFTIRWRADVVPTDRIEEAGRTWDIEHVAERGARREWLELLARKPDAS